MDFSLLLATKLSKCLTTHEQCIPTSFEIILMFNPSGLSLSNLSIDNSGLNLAVMLYMLIFQFHFFENLPMLSDVVTPTTCSLTSGSAKSACPPTVTIKLSPT